MIFLPHCAIHRASYILAQDRGGYGSYGGGGGGGFSGDFDIAVDGDLILAAIAAAGAAFFYFTYNAITAGKRKKRSDVEPNLDSNLGFSLPSWLTGK